MMALARKAVSGDGEDADAEPVEAALAQARDAEELLVDDGWKAVEIEPEAIPVNSLPRTGYGGNGNGHHVDGVGPTVQLIPANGNGRHDDAGEPRQSLFSWAEFMAEPVKPKGRRPRPRHCPSSSGRWNGNARRCWLLAATAGSPLRRTWTCRRSVSFPH